MKKLGVIIVLILFLVGCGGSGSSSSLPSSSGGYTLNEKIYPNDVFWMEADYNYNQAGLLTSYYKYFPSDVTENYVLLYNGNGDIENIKEYENWEGDITLEGESRFSYDVNNRILLQEDFLPPFTQATFRSEYVWATDGLTSTMNFFVYDGSAWVQNTTTVRQYNADGVKYTEKEYPFPDTGITSSMNFTYVDVDKFNTAITVDWAGTTVSTWTRDIDFIPTYYESVRDGSLIEYRTYIRTDK